MKRILYCLLGLVLLVPTRAPFGYEDQTHQALTRQAVKIATQNGVPATFFTDDQVKAIINGAGEGPGVRGGGDPVATDGEDYTRYKSKGCDGVVPYVYKWEPLNHFAGGMLIGGPAYVRFVTFYDDAVHLWKVGNRKDAAFILGRAIHLIEDMAQPQHASNEAHPDKCYFGYGPKLSFLEEMTEAQVNGTSLCPERGALPPRIYPGLIGGLTAFELKTGVRSLMLVY